MIDIRSSRSVPNSVVVGPNVNALKNLVIKSLVRTGIFPVPTIVNLGVFYKWRGEELGWNFFTICTIDGEISCVFGQRECLSDWLIVTLSLTVVHFLTVDKKEDESLQLGGIWYTGGHASAILM